jgi:hypothetical protein
MVLKSFWRAYVSVLPNYAHIDLAIPLEGKDWKGLI